MLVYRINSNKRAVCYVVGIAPSGKVWHFLFFHLPCFAVIFAHFTRKGILDHIAHRSLIRVNTVGIWAQEAKQDSVTE